ncbi:alpha/beta hydrolase family protein [Hymenobacter volaticus]|uniref:Prolyl oligopeptidase family serine peptidase n=1 Tax=Hymenobacter volaticus TaxID=2932254 RepID=A0ABY4G5H9_9BACT|nr:prolyl oligopeptidase family serine peptidase [Hymenobacter volaticus]UOQ66150.1 prolyl oligopeptidase family serine peptidase [Hymenobacter volaticus]
MLGLSCYRLLLMLGMMGLLGGCQGNGNTSAQATEPGLSMPPDTTQWVGKGKQRLHVQSYHSSTRTARPTLVVVLHGDAPFRPPEYQYTLARQVAAAYPNVVAVGLLRPGYTDPQGHHSAGVRGEATGDNYTPEVVAAVAAALTELRQRYHADRLVVAGHSGGAAITANVLARYPNCIDAALLASCPCDVPRWRQHMQQLDGGEAIWEAPVRSLSPLALADSVDATRPITLLVGTADSVAPPRFSRTYWQALRRRHSPARLVQLPGEGHEIFLSTTVRQEIGSLLSEH